MSTLIGRFEIISQIAQSSATVYKALDMESQQTVALKVISLEKVQAKDREALVKRVFEEAEQAKPLSSHNIAALHGVGDEDGQLLAATEYVQGNSVATTLARKDGFSIWDLQDIARQVCQALDHAQVHKVVHRSLEPAKVMVQWDGMVKVLGFGISPMNGCALESSGVAEVLHYTAPEQLCGQPCDHRSALFSLGAILYEMATEQKAFPGETADQVRTAILDGTPPLPVRLKPNVNPGLSQLIMKAISKSPEERYQSGQELVRDLEQCKNANSLAGNAGTKLKAQAAAAGAGAGSTPVAKNNSLSSPLMEPVAPSPAPLPLPKMNASAAVAEKPKPGFAIDPMMAEENDASPAAKVRKSFSELSELPPLKEVQVPGPPPPSNEPEVAEELPQVELRKSAPEKPKIQVRAAAQKAVNKIRKTPPKLYMYALAVTALVIGLIIVGMTISNYMQDRDTGTPSAASAPPVAPAAAPRKTAAPAPAPAIPQPEEGQIEPAQADTARQEAAFREATDRRSHGKKGKSYPAPVVAQAELSVSSTPAGAQITFDGSPLCESPCTLTGIAPGQHVVAASKPGYSAESRTLTMSSGTNSSLAIQLNPLQAKLSVASTPAGAVILVDGKDTGKLTPSQFALETAGSHTVLLRRYGYLDETSSVNTEPGQIANVNLILKQLGSTDEIRSAGGKFKKVFGGGDAASMGTVSIKTQPKGAQIMVNNRVLDKTSPFDFYLNPGTYAVDITMSGYRSVHRIINVEQREKVAMEVMLTPE
jgi:serine/threonine protein kinase